MRSVVWSSIVATALAASCVVLSFIEGLQSVSLAAGLAAIAAALLSLRDQ
jgi:hypothetical protein